MTFDKALKSAVAGEIADALSRLGTIEAIGETFTIEPWRVEPTLVTVRCRARQGVAPVDLVIRVTAQS